MWKLAVRDMQWTVILPWVLSVLTAGAGIWQFAVQQGQANKRPFLEQQLAISVETTDTAARLATETDPVEWDKARASFWRLYWGRMSLVEDRGVESRMVEFGRLIPMGPIAADKLPQENLQVPALNLAHAQRQLILESWGVKLAPLQGQLQ